VTAARTTRRLPGFRFEAQPPPLDEVLPRMDVAVFVGFAAAGPLHVPVAVEDAAQFAALFGEDAALAWDARRGETIHAHLGPAVRAFFRNGGRRCWVVRVARRARPNTFPVPGLARLKATGKLAPAFAVARSEGSWSDSLRAAASLLSRSLVVGRFDSLTDFEIELHAGDELAAGDLLRLTFAEGFTPMVVVRSVAPADEGGGGGRPARATVRVRGGEARWFRQPGRAPIVKQGRAHLFTFDGRAKTAAATVAPNSPWGRGQAAPAGKPVALNLALRPADAPAPGSVVRARLGTRWLWLRADEVRVLGGGGAGAVQVSGEAVWLLRNPPTRELTTPPLCEKLLFELRARRGDEDPVGLPDLGFTSAHPRFWGALPTDAAFYRRGAPRADAAREALWREAAGPRFPLAGPGGSAAAGGVYFPVLMPTFPREYAAPRARRESSLRRDGLAGFGSELFLDPALAETGADVLLSRADFIRYQSRRPRPLDGVHAALELEEATIVVVPDAVHLGWEERHESDPHPQASAPLPHPEWWRFLDCAERPQAPAVEEPLRENFLDCGLRVIPAPKLAAGQPDAAGTLALSWSGEPGARFVLEEATLPDWSGAAVIYEGAETQTVVYGRGSGTYFYRVRAEAGGRSSNWSNGVGVRVQASGGWLSKPAAQYRPATLAEVHCALLRVCAARGDLFAVLSLPDHYREDDALGHANLLKPAGPSSAPRTSLIAPLGYGETHALSFGAVYHPWLVSASEGGPGNSLRRSPPDGAAAGVLARRAFARGAWVAPANELLRGVVALDPPLRRTHLAALHEAQVNVVRQEPRGFLALSADTLSEETDYRPIGVRRLLSLLRRMALQLGARYVFEPHDEAFRRLVRRGFEGMLGEMFARGAFAGRSPAESFRVVTDSTLNTNRMTDLGRFVVELKVAPSLPLTFLTIRLVQSGDRGLTATER
jgi:hypothetical protein